MNIKYDVVENPRFEPWEMFKIGDRYYLNRKQVAEIIGIADRTLQKWTWRGKGPKFFRIGKRVLYTVEAVQKWFEEVESGQAVGGYRECETI